MDKIASFGTLGVPNEAFNDIRAGARTSRNLDERVAAQGKTAPTVLPYLPAADNRSCVCSILSYDLGFAEAVRAAAADWPFGPTAGFPAV